MKLCRSRSLICVNYIQKCRFLMFSSRFRLLLQNKTFKPRSHTGGALIADFHYIEILTHCLLYYLLPSHAFLNMCFRYPDNWIRQLNQTMIDAPTLWATLFLAFPLPTEPVLWQISASCSHLHVYWCNFILRGGGVCTTKKEVLSDTIKFIIYFGDILARRTLGILLAFHLPSRCEV